MAGPARPAIARLVKAADFERVLRMRSMATSEHFALHHLPAGAIDSPKLSTDGTTLAPHPVDDRHGEGRAAQAPLQALGAVVPKRHARRAVTRSLLKRQIYGIATDRLGGKSSGLWVVRLRAPFDRARFPSAASDALRRCARAELESLFVGLPPAASGR